VGFESLVRLLLTNDSSLGIPQPEFPLPRISGHILSAEKCIYSSISCMVYSCENQASGAVIVKVREPNSIQYFNELNFLRKHSQDLSFPCLKWASEADGIIATSPQGLSSVVGLKMDSVFLISRVLFVFCLYFWQGLLSVI
jgi:hypothetical protein